MAKKDKKKWLELFYKRWGYKPTSAIRKKREYIRKIPLWSALEIASETGHPFLIQVIFPFESRFPISKKSSDSVTIFPQALYYDKKSLYEIDKPVLYEGIFYALNSFIAKCPDNLMQNVQDMFDTYVFSLPYFMLSPDEIKCFRKMYLTPIKKQIVKTNIYPEGRGITKRKFKELIKDRDAIIMKEAKKQYKKTGRKKYISIKTIQKKLDDYRRGKEFSDEEDKKFIVTDATVRRTIQKYI
jgi:hypothetical protein